MNTTTDILTNVLRLREALLKGNFWDQPTIERFVSLFQQYVEILKYEYDPNTFTITIKIKKTAARKISNFRPESYFYYSILGNVMLVILKENKERVIQCLCNYQNKYNIHDSTVYDLYFAMTTNQPTYLYNMANLQCITDNIVQIVL
jgi:hypothetical protein